MGISTNHGKIQFSFRFYYFILALLSLFLGMSIYLFFRNSNLLIWSIVPKPAFVNLWNMPLIAKKDVLSVVVYSGPDALWLLSGIFILRFIWFFERKPQMVYIASFYLIAAFWAVGSFFGAIPGTFDFIDLLVMSGVALAEGIIFNFSIKRRIKDENFI